ncbi:MAG: hypothetical protein GY801_36295 [bacterium]|nr:hypothetical protein [bacterium]
MFDRRFLKNMACVILVAYVSVFNAECILAADLHLLPNHWLLLAQTGEQTESFIEGSATKEAQQAVYFSKIQRLEADINRKRGTRNTLMTVAVSSGLIGAGVALGSSAIYSEVENINSDDLTTQNDIDSALKALDMAQGVGWGIVALGGVSLVGYLLYSGSISGDQRDVDELYGKQVELNTRRGEFSEYLPEYLQENEIAKEIWDDIADTKKSAGRSRSFAGTFSRLSIGTILSGGFLFGLSSLTNEVVKEIEVDPGTDEEDARNKALDAADNLEVVGLALLGTGAVCGIGSYYFGRQAKKKDKEIDGLEEQILQVADRLDIQPKRDGFMLSYSYSFK